MSTTSSLPSSPLELDEDRWGRALAHQLSQSTTDLHPDIGARLRVARLHALSHRKLEARPLPVPRRTDQSAPASVRWWTWGASAFPLLALVVGLVAITQWQAEAWADEVAEIDAALLTDELPTAAYTDPGFRQFLQPELLTH